MNPQKLDRVFEVLEYLSAQDSAGKRLREISDDLALPISSTHDLLKAMLQSGLAVRGQDRSYSVGPRAVRTALLVVEHGGLERVARRHLMALTAEVGADVYLAGKLGSDVIYLQRYPGPNPLTVRVRLGTPLALHCTAVGKLFAAMDSDLGAQVGSLAELPRYTSTTITSQDLLRRELRAVREARLSLSRGESYDGVVGFAAPIPAGGSSIWGAVNVSLMKRDISAPRVSSIIQAMRRAADAVTQELAQETHGKVGV